MNDGNRLVEIAAVNQNINQRSVRGTCGACALVACTMASGLCNLAGAQSSPPLFIPIAPLPGTQYCEPAAISGDASTVVGSGVGGIYQGFVWTVESGTVGLNWLEGTNYGRAEDVSEDGSVIVGESGLLEPEIATFAVRWSRDGVVQALPSLPGAQISSAEAVSADGQVIAGNGIASLFDDDMMGFRWTKAAGLTTVGSLAPNPPATSRINGISANGLVLVGDTDPNGDFQRSIRWTSNGMQQIYFPSGVLTSARAASSNGSVIVGGGGDAYRWTAATGAQILPEMLTAFAVSADGSVIVGRDIPFSTHIAKLWTQQCGTRALRDLLIYAGVPGLENWQINIAYDIADDNRTIVGMGTDPQGQQHGFLARLPKTGDVDFDGLVNVSDLLTTIKAWGPCPTSTCPFVDVNCDGVVNDIDLLSVIGHWDE